MLYGEIKQCFITWRDEERYYAERERGDGSLLLVSALPDHPRETSQSHLTNHHEAIQHTDLSVRFGGPTTGKWKAICLIPMAISDCPLNRVLGNQLCFLSLRLS